MYYTWRIDLHTILYPFLYKLLVEVREKISLLFYNPFFSMSYNVCTELLK